MKRSADHREADVALFVLIHSHRYHADELAGRTVLQALLGHAVVLARRMHVGHPSLDVTELLAAAVAAVWQTVKTFPVERRRRRIAANIALDSKRTLAGELAVLNPVQSRTLDQGRMELIQSASYPGDDQDPGVELLEVLAWGVDEGVISAADASLLTRVYCPAPGLAGGAAVADELGVSWATVRQRCSRAVRRLASAVGQQEGGLRRIHAAHPTLSR